MDYASYWLPTPKKGAGLAALVDVTGGRLLPPGYRGYCGEYVYGGCGAETARFITGNSCHSEFYRNDRQERELKRNGWPNSHMNWALRKHGYGLLPVNNATVAEIIERPDTKYCCPDGRRRMFLFDVDFGLHGVCYGGNSYFTLFKGKLRHAGDVDEDYSTKERFVGFLLKHEIYNAFVVYHRETLAAFLKKPLPGLDDALRREWEFDPARLRYCRQKGELPVVSG